MKSLNVKRSVMIAGHNTSICLEDAFWSALQDIAKERDQTVNHLVSSIDANRDNANLSSAVRLYVLDYYKRGKKSPRSIQ
jgi:predicted DNA-binding ribbon-helix-helix protein